jgi:hypothetical protein
VVADGGELVAAYRHGDSGFIRRGDHLCVADRAAGLDDGFRPGGDGGFQAIGEGEEGVGGDGAVCKIEFRRLAFQAAMRAESTRFIWPAPMPIVALFLA